jgi:hypothetical protein
MKLNSGALMGLPPNSPPVAGLKRVLGFPNKFYAGF